MMKIVLAGGSGALGHRIADDLTTKGHDIVALTRTPSTDAAYRHARWDGRNVGDWAHELAGAVLINLAGAIVDRRPSAKNVELLTRSRVEPTRALAQASAGLAEPPVLWIDVGYDGFDDAGRVRGCITREG